MRNTALIFIKPHAVTESAVAYVEEFLGKGKVLLLDKSTIDAEEIRREDIVDRHYFAIAHTAVHRTPAEYAMTEDARAAFADAFGVSWEDAIHAGRVLNALEAQEQLGGVSGAALDEKWKQSQQAKLAPGLYAAYFADRDYFCINGFYPGQRELFTASGAQVVLYEASFNPEDTSWERFRSEVIGATDPAAARPGSLRNQLLEHWGELGLSDQPEKSRNGIHASAGPLEGLRERMVWLDTDPLQDEFGAALLEAGMSEERLRVLLENPVLRMDGREEPVFDLTEDLDADAAVQRLTREIEG
jgi:nucleoside diphosphate kinase